MKKEEGYGTSTDKTLLREQLFSHHLIFNSWRTGLPVSTPGSVLSGLYEDCRHGFTLLLLQRKI